MGYEFCSEPRWKPRFFKLGYWNVYQWTISIMHQSEYKMKWGEIISKFWVTIYLFINHSKLIWRLQHLFAFLSAVLKCLRKISELHWSYFYCQVIQVEDIKVQLLSKSNETFHQNNHKFISFKILFFSDGKFHWIEEKFTK